MQKIIVCSLAVLLAAAATIPVPLLPAEAAGPFRRRLYVPPRPAATAPVRELVPTPAKPPMRLDYPAARKTDQVDDYHGTKVADPYRWLEDVDSDQTRAWVEAQNKATFDWLGKVASREPLRR